MRLNAVETGEVDPAELARIDAKRDHDLAEYKRNIQVGSQMIALLAATPPETPSTPDDDGDWALLAGGGPRSGQRVKLTPVERQMSALLAAGNFREADKLLPEFDAESFGHTHKPAVRTVKAEPPPREPTPFDDQRRRIYPDHPLDAVLRRVYGSIDAYLAAKAERRKAGKLTDQVKRTKRTQTPSGYAGRTTMTLAFDPHAQPRYPGSAG